ncbi:MULTISPECIES: hypothetical protein [unclassified Borrelia]|nr:MULTISPECIES: hypothetical protein [unclassified Borrelia]UGQ16595.1 hypothetical protein LSO06_04580 [Borrelia sp. RT5S]UGQ17734.1 hypothetical protein LSO05_04720 [Borrelia sp. RT1S]
MSVESKLSSEIKEVRNELNDRIDKLDGRIDTVKMRLRLHYLYIILVNK